MSALMQMIDYFKVK